MRKIFSLIFTVFVLCLCMSGCTSLTNTAGMSNATKITDDNQRVVTLKKIPERIVVLSPSFLELVEVKLIELRLSALAVGLHVLHHVPAI